jgi:hypothetical protein
MVDNKKIEKQLRKKIRSLLRKMLKEQVRNALETQKREKASAKKAFLTEVELISHLYKLNSKS